MLFKKFKQLVKSKISEEPDEVLTRYSQQIGDVNLSAISSEILEDRNSKKKRKTYIGFMETDFPLEEI